MSINFLIPAAAALLLGSQAPAPEQQPATAKTMTLESALSAPSRSAANRARDPYRHPGETLSFFGVMPTDTVVELWPGGGWYTEILAPYLAAGGKLRLVPPAGRYDERIRAKLAGDPIYENVTVATFTANGPTDIAPESADVVLTFRNVHSWLDGKAPIADQIFREAFRVLKPGGTLGVVEHRLPEEDDDGKQMTSGYVKVSTVRSLAEAAGFRFVETSEINANPRDSKDYAGGVWTLPPTLRLGDTDREKYLAIGESDRMTLKFVKP